MGNKHSIDSIKLRCWKIRPKDEECSCSFEDLPILVHDKILKFLEFDDKMNLRSVSKGMRAFIDTKLDLVMIFSGDNYAYFKRGRLPLPIQTLIIDAFNLKFGARRYLTLTLNKVFPSVTTIECIGPMSPENYTALLKGCCLLTDLRLHTEFLAGEQGIHTVETHCPTLQHFSITLKKCWSYIPSRRVQKWPRNVEENLVGILDKHTYPNLKTFKIRVIPIFEFPNSFCISIRLLLKFTSRQPSLAEVTFNFPRFQPLNPSAETEVLQHLKDMKFKFNLRVRYLQPAISEVLSGINQEVVPTNPTE